MLKLILKGGDMMVEYLEEMLGIKVKMHTWEEIIKLPVYLRCDREYYLIHVEEQESVVIKMSAQRFNLSTFQKHILKLRNYTNLSIVLWLDSVSTYQRQALIKNKMPFIVPKSQMYVPFWGICFRERMQKNIEKKEKLTAMAQYILLYMIYNPNKDGYTQKEITIKLNVSAMNVSRGIAELREMQLVTMESTGRSKCIEPVACGKELYQLSKDYMQSPIQKKIYIRENVYMDLLVAGEEALAMKTMLNSPNKTIRALDKKKIDIILEQFSVDPKWELEADYVELELWKYDPERLCVNDTVDEISLLLSLQDIEDERIEEQIENMMERYSS